MPFKSKKQMRYLFSQKPDIAEKFSKDTKNFKSLPMRAKKQIKSLRKLSK